MERTFLEKMLLCRRFDEEIIKRYPKQLMRCPVHLSIGQEAIAVGVCHHLRKEDSVFSTHRNHAHYIAKGGDIEKFALELHGKVGGCNDGRGGSMHAIDTSVSFLSGPIVASAIPLAVGAALANKIDGNGNIAVCFFGDAAVEEGAFHESMNFASLMQLPIIFVCENNQYSVDTHISKRQPDRTLSKVAYQYKIDCSYVRSDDIIDLAEWFDTNVIIKARMNYPQFVISDVQRSHVHCGVDKEFELAHDPLNGPINAVDKELVLEQLEKYKNEIDCGIKNKIIAAFDAAEAAPLPTPEMAKDYVYA